MKRTIKLSIWGALIILANQTNAISFDSSLEVKIVGSKVFELTMNNLKGDIKISILNTSQKILYSENFSVSNVNFKRTFDLGSFPDGSYRIEFIDTEKSQSIPLSIKDDKLSINTTEKVVYFLPVVYKKDNMVSVQMPVLSAEYLDISILNESDEIMYEVKLKGERNLGKVFDFSKSYKGSYKFLLSSNAGFVSKEIQID